MSRAGLTDDAWSVAVLLRRASPTNRRRYPQRSHLFLKALSVPHGRGAARQTCQSSRTVCANLPEGEQKEQLAATLTLAMLVTALGALLDSLGMIAVCQDAESTACWLVWALGIPLTIGIVWLAVVTLRRMS
jgi:hypothetical protein